MGWKRSVLGEVALALGLRVPRPSSECQEACARQGPAEAKAQKQNSMRGLFSVARMFYLFLGSGY